MRLPPFAAWRHHTARQGFEVAYFDQRDDALRVRGYTTAVEEGQAFAVEYELSVDSAWRTREAKVISRTADATAVTRIEGDGAGNWLVDGVPAEQFAGRLDVDLEASALTNAFPARRIALGPGQEADAPALYVRAFNVAAEPLEQRYRRLDDGSEPGRYDYHAPRFDFRCELVYDAAGLVTEYPGLASRA